MSGAGHATQAPVARENVYAQASEQAPKAWGHVPMMAAAAGTLWGMSRGFGFGNSMTYVGFGNPVTAASYSSNPWGRSAQNQYDQKYLSQSRQMDAQAGLPSLRKTSAMSEERNNLGRNLALGAAGTGLLAAGVLGRRHIARHASRLHDRINPTVSRPVSVSTTPPRAQLNLLGSTPQETGRVTVTGRRFGLPSTRTVQSVKDGVSSERVENLLSISDRFRAASAGQQIGALAVSLAGLGAAAHGAKAAGKGIGKIQEGRRYEKAMDHVNLDAAAGLSYYSPEERADLRREAEDKLRTRFSVLNQYAPNVARDPLLAAEFLSREAVRAQDVVSPEEYLRKVKDAVDLENAIQRSQPDPLGGAPLAAKIIGM